MMMIRAFFFSQIDSNISIGAAGILIILLSISTGVGFLSYAGVKLNWVTVQVLPYIILALGFDNVFILIKGFQVGLR